MEEISVTLVVIPEEWEKGEAPTEQTQGHLLPCTELWCPAAVHGL